MFFFITVILIIMVQNVALNSAQITSIENPDGSYSIGLNAEGQGSTADAVLGLLSLSSGWTLTTLQHPDPNSVPTVPSLKYILKEIRKPLEVGIQKILTIIISNLHILRFVVRIIVLVLDFFRVLLGNIK